MSSDNNEIHLEVSQHITQEKKPLCIVADGMHILNPHVHKAIMTQDKKMLIGLARKLLPPAAQALAVNLGPGKEMVALLPWVIDTIRGVTDKPLFFSASILTNAQVMQTYGAQITINAVTAEQKDLVQALTMAKRNGSSVVVLLTRSGMVTSGIDERIRLASEVIEQALLCDFQLSRLYLDPVLSCHPDPDAWRISRGLPDVGGAVETLSLIRQLDSKVRTIAALGNVPAVGGMNSRSTIHSRVLFILSGAGLDAVLLNCLDREIMQTALDLREGKPVTATHRKGRDNFNAAA